MKEPVKNPSHSWPQVGGIWGHVLAAKDEL
jgi:hypothetical protein